MELRQRTMENVRECPLSLFTRTGHLLTLHGVRTFTEFFRAECGGQRRNFRGALRNMQRLEIFRLHGDRADQQPHRPDSAPVRVHAAGFRHHQRFSRTAQTAHLLTQGDIRRALPAV